MLIESDPHQTRIAVLEDDRLTEIFVERHRHRGLVGNVYKGRVTRVLPGMQAAFVDVGLERDAFLYVSDVASDVEAMEDELEIGDSGAGSMEPVAHHGSPSIDELLKPGQEIIVDTGHLVAYDDTIQLQIGMLQNAVTAGLTGEGLVARMTAKDRGRVWIQTRSHEAVGGFLFPEKTQNKKS